SLINTRHYETSVPDGATCASICGIMWLASSTRHIAANAEVGFHAAYRKDGSESGQANAMIGAFLGHIGMSYDVVEDVTSAPPKGMNWLSHTKADQLGIVAIVHPVQTAAIPTMSAVAPVATTIPPADPVIASFAEGRKRRATPRIRSGRTDAFRRNAS